MASTDTDGMNGTEVPAVMVHSTGLYMVGGLMGYKVLPPRESNGAKFENTEIGLLVAGEVVAVQAPTKVARDLTGDAAKGDVIALRVESRSGIKDGRPWQFYVTFRGGSLDASDFGF
jgi:hypothetical protein